MSVLPGLVVTFSELFNLHGLSVRTLPPVLNEIMVSERLAHSWDTAYGCVIPYLACPEPCPTFPPFFPPPRISLLPSLASFLCVLVSAVDSGPLHPCSRGLSCSPSFPSGLLNGSSGPAPLMGKAISRQMRFLPPWGSWCVGLGRKIRQMSVRSPS